MARTLAPWNSCGGSGRCAHDPRQVAAADKRQSHATQRLAIEDRRGIARGDAGSGKLKLIWSLA